MRKKQTTKAVEKAKPAVMTFTEIVSAIRDTSNSAASQEALKRAAYTIQRSNLSSGADHMPTLTRRRIKETLREVLASGVATPGHIYALENAFPDSPALEQLATQCKIGGLTWEEYKPQKAAAERETLIATLMKPRTLSGKTEPGMTRAEAIAMIDS